MYKRRKWTEKEDLKLIKLVERNYTNDQLVRTLGRTENAINIRKSILGIRKERHRWTAQEDRKLEKLYRKGYSISKIAKEMNITYMSAYNRLNRLKVFLDKEIELEELKRSNKLKIKKKIQEVEEKLEKEQDYKIIYVFGKSERVTNTKILTYVGATKDLFIFKNSNYKITFRKLDLINKDLRIEAIGKKKYKTA